MNRGGLILLFAWPVLIAFEHFFIKADHAAHGWQAIKGFHLLLGFAAGFGLMLWAKLLSRYGLHRPENYYHQDEGGGS